MARNQSLCDYYPDKRDEDVSPAIWALDWEFGDNTGYGMWCRLKGSMRRAENARGMLDLNDPPTRHALAALMKVEVGTLMEFCDACARVELIYPVEWEHRLVVSPWVERCNRAIEEGREQRKAASKAAAEKRKAEQSPVGTPVGTPKN